MLAPDDWALDGSERFNIFLHSKRSSWTSGDCVIKIFWYEQNIFLFTYICIEIYSRGYLMELPEKNIAEKFHKGTVLLAEKLIGTKSEKFSTFPFVAKVGENYACFVPGEDLSKINLDYLHPYIVNAGLTLELKLKQLLMVENNDNVRGHNLGSLYKSLSSESKTFISLHVLKRTSDSTDHRTIAEAAKNSFNLELKWEAEFLLEKSAYAFERWRYLHEKNNKGSWFAGYIEVYNALDERIKSY